MGNKPNVNTLAIKATVFNPMRKAFYGKKLEEISIAEKEKMFDQIFKNTAWAHEELNSYKNKRKVKNRVQSEREKRGYAPKKKTSLAEYQKMISLKEPVSAEDLENQ